MKFIHYLEKIAGIDIYGVISFAIFGLFFMVMLTWVFKSDKKVINDISRIPLDN
jgi:cytochrome c oxidase cbb3-type subunit IV